MVLGSAGSPVWHIFCLRVRSASSLAGAPQAVPPLVVLLKSGDRREGLIQLWDIEVVPINTPAGKQNLGYLRT